MKECLICIKKFEPNSNAQKYCRDDCYGIVLKQRRKIYAQKHKEKLGKEEYLRRKRSYYQKYKEVYKKYYLKTKHKRPKFRIWSSERKKVSYACSKNWKNKNKEKVLQYKRKYNRKFHSAYGSKKHYESLQESSYNKQFDKTLKKNNYYFIAEFMPFHQDRKFRADFFIPSLNLCLDIHGRYWHDYERFPEKRKQDKEKEMFFKSLGYDYKVLWVSHENKDNLNSVEAL